MSKSKKQQFNVSTAEVPARAEYDDEELDFVKGKKIQVQAAGRTGGGSDDGPKAYNFTGVAPGKTYLHPPDRLIKGRVIYPVKYVGQLKVAEPRGKQVVRDAIEMVKVAAEVRKANNPGWDIPDVDLSISIRSLMCLQRGTKKVLHQHPIHVISFSADDKRDEGSIFAYITKPKPPAVDHICYVYECSHGQALELTTTIGEAFELAYKKFLEAKKAQEEFNKLKQRLETASPQEKEEIKKQLEAIEAKKAIELEKRRQAAERKAKEEAERSYTPDDLISLKVKGPPKYYRDVTEDVDLSGQDPEVAKQLAAVQREAQAIEVKSELERQSKMKHNTSVAEKWETFTSALEPFESTAVQVRRFQMKELDDVISGLEGEITELEEAFNWEPGKRKVAPYNSSLFQEEVDSGPDLSKKLSDIEEQFKSVQNAGDEMEIPELPANYVMDEFQKAREKASLPKQGSVIEAAGSWYQKHHD